MVFCFGLGLTLSWPGLQAVIGLLSPVPGLWACGLFWFKFACPGLWDLFCLVFCVGCARTLVFGICLSGVSVSD